MMIFELSDSWTASAYFARQGYSVFTLAEYARGQKFSSFVVENSTWGAPHMHGELLMLGFDVSERTISRWMKRTPRDPEPARHWLTFLRNHREAIAAMDFFTVPTITFSSLYCFFVISHDRRRILHFNITKHPTSSWIVQQLREAFPFGSAPRFVIFSIVSGIQSLSHARLHTGDDGVQQNNEHQNHQRSSKGQAQRTKRAAI
jgi:hypothetical protein